MDQLKDALVRDYLSFARSHRGRRTTHQLENAFAHFFSWLQRQPVSELRQLRPNDVSDFITSLGHLKRSTVAVLASALRGFFEYLFYMGELEINLALAVERPPVYRNSVPPAVLEDDVVERLLSAIDLSTALGKRDYAMLALAIRYGLRASDIRALRFENISWRQQRIVLVQSKTQRTLELPLMADVGEALVEYIRNGRPCCSCREVFVRHVRPIAPLANNLRSVMKRALRGAGLELEAYGFQLLRHTAATRMLRHGVRLDTISDVLGHASVDTTRRYLQVDLAGLSSVALSDAEVRR